MLKEESSKSCTIYFQSGRKLGGVAIVFFCVWSFSYCDVISAAINSSVVIYSNQLSVTAEVSSGHSGSAIALNTIGPGIAGSSTAISVENHNILLLFYLGQLFLRELFKSYRLIQVVPMDMSGYYGK